MERFGHVFLGVGTISDIIGLKLAVINATRSFPFVTLASYHKLPIVLAAMSYQ